MRYLSAALLLLALAVLPGCATWICKDPKVVEVPVAVPCRTPEIAKPTLHFDNAATEGMSLYDKVTLLLSQDYSLKAYSAQLEAAVKACNQQP